MARSTRRFRVETAVEHDTGTTVRRTVVLIKVNAPASAGMGEVAHAVDDAVLQLKREMGVDGQIGTVRG